MIQRHEQRPLRPEQMTVAVAMAQAGSPPDRIAAVLAVDVDRVAQALRDESAATENGRDEPVLEVGAVLVVGERADVVSGPRPANCRAPVYVEDSPGWPLPATEPDEWFLLPRADGQLVRCRQVTLWDEQVMVDAGRGVFCLVCHEFVDPVEMGRDQFAGRGVHMLGLPRASLLRKAAPR